MFQRLTRLFFSEEPADNPVEPKHFVTEEEDDGWLIIDIPDSFALTSSEDGVVQEQEESLAPCPLSHSLAERVGWSIPPHPPHSMDESWFVTPPPCFTAESSGPSVVGSSPLEDLLIEHPSMSVYITSGSIVVEREPSEITRDRSPSKTRVERRTSHHTSSVTAKAAILGKVGQVSRIQRAKALVDKRKLGRKNLQRQNLAREFHGRNATRHQNFMCQPRQRQYNH
ncbi:tumor protein p53-inducible nuclear protein 2 [Bombina bombina]|uniref:tumor protein p53-inducible nuclear protein 2 n=1 Tax=Bombina bombina TaxID=8345 RepID=UPI00235A6144|nr:tumor protein p53-inducible nuclear protein 2 [Bombina bombina]XP_053569528.1 tumor protein p53-inducible nuclear protein 2 [Bombina bombina]